MAAELEVLTFRKLFNQLDEVDEILKDGPDDDEQPEAFRKRIGDKLNEARQSVVDLTDEEIEAEYFEEEEE